ncbi:Uncharacterised protein [Anaerotruncus sp. 2789STDY5834896]|uniref:Neutral/alkaline non-lysosomal ceramidase N-terminal domain-containing protein n=1 Tax=uncultured Anaerotruncus sp. TaxID=905011 RepID=A0A1C6HRW6_9FIRM|nr:Uncharacterised protein [uncultured Anaerotruncus sp.]
MTAHTPTGAVQVGYAAADITPTMPVQLIGFAREDDTSRGVLEPLVAQVLLFDQGGDRCCLVTLDLLGLTQQLGDRLRDELAQLLCCARSQVMLCCSHTHSGPDCAAVPAYYRFLCRQVSGAARAALQDLAPAAGAWAVVRAAIGQNRRGDGPVDDRIGALKLARPGRPDLLLIRLTAHPNVLTWENRRISPDYFGAVRRQLGAQLGAEVLVTQGAAGNIRPAFRWHRANYLETHPLQKAALARTPQLMLEIERDSLAALERMAAAVAAALAPAVTALPLRPLQVVRMVSDWLDCTSPVPDPQQERAIAGEAWTMGQVPAAGWRAEIARLRRSGVAVQHTPVELQFLQIDGGCLCGTICEAMCELALEAAELADDELLFFGGYTGGCSGYLPDTAEYDRGGYEVLWSMLLYYPYHGRVMPLDRDTGHRLAVRAAACWRALRAGGPLPPQPSTEPSANT